MEVNINLTPEQVEQEIVRTIIETSVGAAIKKEIESALSELTVNTYNRDSVVKRVVQGAVEVAVAEAVNEHKPVIEAHVRETLTSEVMSALTERTMDTLIEKMRRY